MTESTVTYVKPNRTDAGAVPVNTQVATHPRFSDNASVFVTTTQDQLRWSLQVNPTLSSGLTYAAVANSAVESALGNGTITVTTPGTIIAGGTTSSTLIQPTGMLKLNFLSFLGSTLANVMDQYVLCATPISVSITSYSTLSFREI